MGLVLLVEAVFGLSLNEYGIQPRSSHGLWGFLFSPFLHANVSQLLCNSVPLLILMMGLFYFYPQIAWRVLLIGTLSTNLSVWLFARPGDHIGASGVVYLFGFFSLFLRTYQSEFSTYGPLTYRLLPVMGV